MIKLFYSLLLIFLSCALIQAQNDEYSIHFRIVEEATKLYQKKDYSAALATFEKAMQTAYGDKSDYYNAACCASLIGDLNKANQYLIKSIDTGFWDLAWMLQDSDFDNLRKTDQWKTATLHLENLIKSIEQQFIAVKGMKLTDLVPYCENGKWGYMQKKTKKIIVKANFTNVSFAGSCLEIEFQPRVKESINGEGKLNLKYADSPDQRPNEFALMDYNIKIDDNPDFKGFQVDREGIINRISSEIDVKNGRPVLSDLTPVKIGQENYAIAQKKGKFGLYRQDGATHPIIGFKYPLLEEVRNFEGKGAWFLFQDDKNKYGYIHSSGQVKFYGELDSLLTLQGDYSFALFGYEIIKQGDKTGIINLKTMTWLLKPLVDLKFLDVGYTHSGNFCNIHNQTLNDYSIILETYILTKNKTGQLFYLDEEGVQYK